MAALRLYAIGIDEARDLLGATPAVADRARAEAADLFAEPTVPAARGGLLSRLFGGGRHGPVPADPNRPSVEDLDTVLSGHYPTPVRARACWTVLEHLVARRSWGHHVMALDERGIADFDFALARAGGPADSGLAHVLGSDARIALCRVAGLQVGYVPHSRVRGAATALAALDIDPEHADALAALRAFLGQYAGWAAAATALGRPVPDLLAFHDTV